MKITKLRLSGFKSFVEPTELHIEPGRNGVVGPNGCGKSNLVEALRWVMGENSPKNMRGSGMDDVIFAGSGNRPSRNMAEVSVILDNRDRKAPSAFNGEDTLEITRRIEREAGSIYRINGREVRARDVQILFADASTGAHSPALVRQGQIGELIAAKPRNRRMLLEEAAGISGLHSRRHEAELRLKAAETNLTRVQDLAQQLEGQLAGLKRQARQAARYRNLSGDIRALEARLLASRWHLAAQLVERAEAELREARASLDAQAARAAQAATFELEAGLALPPLREEEAKAAAALHRLTVERDVLEGEAKRAADDLTRLAQLLAQAEADRAREAERLSDAQSAIARLGEEEASIRAASDGEAEALSIAQAKFDEARTAQSVQDQALDTATRAQAEAEARRAALLRSLEDVRLQSERFARERQHLDEQRRVLEAEVTQSAVLEAARQTLGEAELRITDAARVLSEAEARKVDTAADEQAAREPLLEADRTVAQLAAEAQAIAKVLGAPARDLWPPVIDAVAVEPGYEAALAAALGDELNVPANSAAPVHWDDLGSLSGTVPMLPDGAIALSRFVKGPAALQRRLSLIGVVTSDAGKALQSLLKPGQRLVSRAGHVWRWDGYTVAAEAQTPEAARLAQRNRFEELKALIADAEAAAAHKRDHYHALRLVAEQAQDGERSARIALRDAESAANQARAALAELEKSEAGAHARLAGIAENQARIEREAQAQALKRVEAQAQLAALESPDVLKARFDEAREAAAAGRHHVTQAQSAVEILKSEERRRNEALAGLSRELAGWHDRKAQAERQIDTLTGRLATARAEEAVLQEKPAQIEEKRLRLIDILVEAEANRAGAADALARAEAALKAAAAEARAADAAVSEARESRARLEAVLAAGLERADELRSHIREALDLSPEELTTQCEAEGQSFTEPVDDLEKKLERLKRERESLGGVNLQADEEANEIEAQLTTMLSEKSDLDEAIAKLRQGISKLNAEGRDRLMGAFDVVNGHFKRLFTHLFGGGEAELRLVESDDPLEAGLEIFARPPGKRLQVMTLLSGGEQALTAMSLIFAVFLSNPAPICVLDEVDAPLDDANVERFCNLVDEMTRLTDTRFLIITHHALTMARMDRLYGVTMAERGVSQLVSVDLAGAVEAVREAG